MKLRFAGKCDDLFDASIINEEGKEVSFYEGYPLDCLGDWGMLSLTIDIKTGKVVGWEGLSTADLKRFLGD